MKQFLYKASLFLLSLLPTISLAHDFEVDGVYYLKNGSNAIVSYRGGYSSEYDEYSGSIVIPSTVTYDGLTYYVTSIGREAFSGCNGLIDIIIPNSVTSIDVLAFWCCSALVSVYLPNSITYIGGDAFLGCTGLTSITIPKSVTFIGDDAFGTCYGLIRMYVESGNPVYDSRDNCNAIIETLSNTLIAGCMNTIIPPSITSIGRCAFRGCYGLTSINIPNSVTSIGNSAFDGCRALTNFTIPNSVTSVGGGAFDGCIGLTSIIIPNSVTSINGFVFSNCSGLKSVTIPNSVTSIGRYAFRGCSGLTSITIPMSVTSIDNYAFLNCSGLTDIYSLALTPPSVYDKSFSGCYGATLFVPLGALDAYNAANYWKDFSQIVGIPEVPVIEDFEVDGIYYRALTENTAMVISRPAGDDYYQGDVEIPESVTYEGYTFTVTSIENGAFEDSYDLNSVVIGDAIESIGAEAFQGCTGLTSVIIGSGVATIGAKAFNYCNALQTVICRGTVPPVMENSNCFSTAAYTRAVLKVPRQELETYANADYWYKFNNIEGFGSIGVGDVNADGVISITDVTALIGMVLGSGEYNADADMNYNGMLDIGDVTSLIVIILHQ